MSDRCVFCEIAQGTAPASIVCEDDLSMAFIDLRQFNPGHALVIPRQHLRDVRDLDMPTGAALMAMVSKVTCAVAATFANQGMSIWHSVGEAAFQEVPHLHFHVHPRMVDDGALQIYPRPPATPDKSVRDHYAATLRSCLEMPGPRSGEPAEPKADARS